MLAQPAVHGRLEQREERQHAEQHRESLKLRNTGGKTPGTRPKHDLVWLTILPRLQSEKLCQPEILVRAPKSSE